MTAFPVTVKFNETFQDFSWENGDILNVNGKNSLPLTTEGKAKLENTVFSFQEPLEFPLSAVFPAKAYYDRETIILPSVQSYQDPRLSYSAAGRSRTGEIRMFPLCGRIRIPVRIATGSEDIESIRLAGNNGETISGRFKLEYNTIGKPSLSQSADGTQTIELSDCHGSGTYTVSVPPVTFTKGLTVTLTSKGGIKKEFATSEKAEIKEARYTDLPEIEFNVQDKSKNLIRTYKDMNNPAGELNSHSSACGRSTMTFVGSSFKRVGEDVIRYDNPNKIGVVYPRFIKNASGEYLMFFHYGVELSWSGNTIAYLKSRNLLDWEFGKDVLLPTRMTSQDGNTTIIRCYAGPDVIKLKDGTLLLVCATRRLNDFQNHPEDGGLAVCTSKDGGASWSEPSYIFLGTCWEPKPFLRPDGRIEIYYTDATYVPDLDINVSGTSYVYSEDNGKTWLPRNPRETHLHAFRQIRDDSVSPVLYTDQMAAVIALNGTDRLAAACESNMTRYGMPTNQYMLTTAYSEAGYSWGTELPDGVIPKDRENHFMVGAAPQLIQFRSGETILSFNKTTNGTSTFYVMTGNAGARNFAAPVKAFNGGNGTGFWGGIFAVSSNVMVMAVGGRKDRSIDIGQMYLNHDIPSEQLSVWLDGRLSEWSGTEALFAGSSTTNQVLLRSAHYGEQLYFALDVAGDGIVDVGFRIYGEKKNIRLSSSGLESTDIKGVTAITKNGETADGRSGWSCEISFPAAVLNGARDIPVELTISGPGFRDSFYEGEVSTDKLPHIRL